MENELYKDAPLVEVVFEIRFPGEPSVECNRDKLYDKIRETYSKVIPRGFEGKSMAAEPYRFEKEDGMCGVMIAINKFAVYCKKYEGFNVFRQETMRLCSIFGELFKIKKITRTGLRYINIIPFTRENNIIPLQNYLNVKIDLPKSIPASFENLNVIFVSKTENGSITTRIEPALSQDRAREVIILDFDYAKEHDLDFKHVEKYLDESHQNTKDLFEGLITDNYRQVMRGEMI